LFNEGMKVLVYSEKGREMDERLWERGGEDLIYY